MAEVPIVRDSFTPTQTENQRRLQFHTGSKPYGLGLYGLGPFRLDPQDMERRGLGPYGLGLFGVETYGL